MKYRHEGRVYKITAEMAAALVLQARLHPHSVFGLLCTLCRSACVGYEPLAGSPAYAPCDCCASRDRYRRAKGGASGPPAGALHHKAPLDALCAVVA